MSGRSFTSVTVTTTSISRTFAGEAVSEARTVTLYTLSPPSSAGNLEVGPLGERQDAGRAVYAEVTRVRARR